MSLEHEGDGGSNMNEFEKAAEPESPPESLADCIGGCDGPVEAPSGSRSDDLNDAMNIFTLSVEAGLSPDFVQKMVEINDEAGQLERLTGGAEGVDFLRDTAASIGRSSIYDAEPDEATSDPGADADEGEDKGSELGSVGTDIELPDSGVDTGRMSDSPLEAGPGPEVDRAVQLQELYERLNENQIAELAMLAQFSADEDDIVAFSGGDNYPARRMHILDYAEEIFPKEE